MAPSQQTTKQQQKMLLVYPVPVQTIMIIMTQAMTTAPVFSSPAQWMC
jgi:hypothetical protein